MVKIEVDVVPVLKIFKYHGVAIITLNGIQINKFFFDEFAENSRNEDWSESHNVARPCVDFYIKGELINVVRNVSIVIAGD